MKNNYFFMGLLLVLLIGQASLRAGLVAHWKLDEGIGVTAADAAGGHTLALTNTTWVTSGLGPVPSGTTAALDFSGSLDVAVATGYTGITGTGARSVAMWIKFDGTSPYSSYGPTLFSNGAITNGQRFDIKLQHVVGQVAQVGKVRFEVGGGFVIANTRVDDGAWHHISASH